MVFLDYLSVYQEFQGQDLPLLASEISTTVCALTGEITKEYTKGYQHLGSFDSTLLIKYDKGVLSVSGNPSHWCKTDNLYGCESVQAGIEIYNRVLKSLGYPEFYDCEDTYLTSSPYAAQNGYIRNGMTITRVDLTLNYASDISAIDILRYLSTNAYRGQPGFLYPNGRTVEWLGTRSGDTRAASKHLYFKYYDKTFDLQTKMSKLLKLRDKLIVKDFNNDANIVNIETYRMTEQINYLTKVLKFSEENNIVRFELELKSKKLNELGLTKLGRWSRELMLQLVDKYTPHLKTKCQFNKKIDLYQQLLDVGISDRRARQSALIGQMWLDGHNVNYLQNKSIKKTTYYAARNALLNIGYDIASPLNVVNFPSQVQTVMLRPLDKPEWYRDNAA